MIARPFRVDTRHPRARSEFSPQANHILERDVREVRLPGANAFAGAVIVQTTRAHIHIPSVCHHEQMRKNVLSNAGRSLHTLIQRRGTDISEPAMSHLELVAAVFTPSANDGS